ncbi:DUF1292 domain-containing protein [Bacillaceae bacterium S4-13-58]
MGLEEKERIIIPDENGDEHLFEVLFTFEVDETGKTYIAVVPEDQKDDEEVEVFAFRYEEKESNGDDMALYELETDEEWDMVEEMLNTFSDDEE